MNDWTLFLFSVFLLWTNLKRNHSQACESCRSSVSRNHLFFKFCPARNVWVITELTKEKLNPYRSLDFCFFINDVSDHTWADMMKMVHHDASSQYNMIKIKVTKLNWHISQEPENLTYQQEYPIALRHCHSTENYYLVHPTNSGCSVRSSARYRQRSTCLSEYPDKCHRWYRHSDGKCVLRMSERGSSQFGSWCQIICRIKVWSHRHVRGRESPMDDRVEQCGVF